MRFGSVCSGIEAASVAWNPLGWKAAWLSEIEPFPCAVLAHHFPDVPNLGDMTVLPEKILSGEVEAPDLLCGGTPCQAFSTAGKRMSLADERGNLSLVFCRIADAIDTARARAGLRPAIIFWENVPGVLNTKDNALGCFFGLLAGSDQPAVAPGGRWPSAGVLFGGRRRVAWRVLDAQHFGVPQRRRRIFVIASADPGFDPAAVLFERKGVSGDPEKGEGEGEGIAADAKDRTGGGVCLASGKNTVATILADSAAKFWSGKQDAFSGDFFVVTPRQHQIAGTYACQSFYEWKKSDKASALKLSTVLAGADSALVVYDMTHANEAIRTCGAFAPTLSARMGTGGNQVPLVFDERAPKHQIRSFSAFSPALTSRSGTGGGNVQMILDDQGGGVMNVRTDGKVGTLRSQTKGHEPLTVGNDKAIRRLTPVECERLQGFPDNWTRIPFRNKPEENCPDSHRYKAIGNSWAVPVIRWIGNRINQHMEGLL